MSIPFTTADGTPPAWVVPEYVSANSSGTRGGTGTGILRGSSPGVRAVTSRRFELFGALDEPGRVHYAVRGREGRGKDAGNEGG